MRIRFTLSSMTLLALALCAATSPAAGETWQPRSGHRMVAFQDALVVSGGLYAFDKTFFFNDLWTSKDGLSWTRAPQEHLYSPQRQMHLFTVFQDSLWVMGGQGGAYLNDVWRSDDGAHWEAMTEAASWSPRRGMAGVVHNERLFLMGGESGARIRHNDVWVTDDGESWELLTGAAQWEPRWEHGALSFEDALYVVGGAGEFGLYNDVWRSEDGIRWERAGTLPAAVRGHCAEVFRGDMVVFGGVNREDKLLNQLWSSPDGVAWTVVLENALWPPRRRHASAVYGNRLWLAGGVLQDGEENDVWHSRDGVKWTPAPGGDLLSCGGCGGGAKTWRLLSGDWLLAGVALLALWRCRRNGARV